MNSSMERASHSGEVPVSEEENWTTPGRRGSKAAFRWIAGLVVVAAIIGAFVLMRGNKAASAADLTLAKAVRGDMEILVLEGGNMEALESLELKSEVETREGAKILSIVEEGYEVTPEDVKNEKVLIKLDPTEMKERIEQHDIEYEASHQQMTEDDEARAIQATESQNEIKVARQAARFALLNLEKYLGEKVSNEVLSQRNLPSTEQALEKYETDFRERLLSGGVGHTASQGDEKKSPRTNEDIIERGAWVRIDFAKYLEAELLGDGEAQQELRKREDELLVAQSEYAVESENVVGSERLAKQNFITLATLEKERVALKKAKIKELSAATQLELYRRYEFPKMSEELLTKYEDSLHLLDIEKKEALAKLSQAESKFRSSEQLFKMAEKKRGELDKQLKSCTIVATKPGLVVYGSGNRNRYYGGSEEKIEEGATVRYKQTLITIPDMSRMKVKVSIQESHIKKIKEGQKVRIVAEAESEKTLTGLVKKVAVLPDSNRWYDNPNQKVYPTEIHVDGTHAWLKPGMSTKVEIIVDQLTDVLKIPLQSVMVDQGDTVAYVLRGGKPVRQVLETGAFNDEFIEVTEGLKEGEMVYLSKPQLEGVTAETGDS